jgi:hypothetical protein
VIEICRVRQIVRDRVRRVRAGGFISSAAIARKGSFTSSGGDEDLL